MLGTCAIPLVWYSFLIYLCCRRDIPSIARPKRLDLGQLSRGTCDVASKQGYTQSMARAQSQFLPKEKVHWLFGNGSRNHQAAWGWWKTSRQERSSAMGFRHVCRGQPGYVGLFLDSLSHICNSRKWRSAKYFSDWIKKTAFGAAAQTIVCRIYARDGDLFDRMNKVCRHS